MKKFKSNVILFIKTLVNKSILERIKVRLGFENMFRVDRVRRGGGLGMFWSNACKLMNLSFSCNHMDAKIQ